MDFYEILQVSRSADVEVIRAAYRVLARRHHPDLGGDPRRMAAVNEAWATLGEPMRRRRYDAIYRRTHAAATTTAAAHDGGIGVMHDRPATDRTAAQTRTGAPRQEARPAADRPPIGPPPARPSVGVLDFGRYAGWSVSDLSRHDPDYLLWLERTPIGRPIRSEIQRVMELRRGAAAATAIAEPRRDASRRGGWFR